MGSWWEPGDTDWHVTGKKQILLLHTRKRQPESQRRRWYLRGRCYLSMAFHPKEHSQGDEWP